MAVKAAEAFALSSAQEVAPNASNRIYVIDEPLVLYPQEGPQRAFTEPFSKPQTLNLQQLMFDSSKFYQLGDEGVKGDFTFSSENRQVNEGLAVLEILYNSNHGGAQGDSPEFVDVTDLTETLGGKEESFVVSDDDDVIFVSEFKEEGKDEVEPRRNPMRKVRNSKASKDLARELLFEEDFAFLDNSDELQDPTAKLTGKKPLDLVMKQWPVNVHDRPQFNQQTQKIESLDYAIPKTKLSVRKAKLEAVRKLPKKKKYVTRRGRKRVIKSIVEKKVPVKELRALVKETFDLVKIFLKSNEGIRKIVENRSDSEEDENEGLDEDRATVERNKLVLLKNQALLFAVCSGLDKSELAGCFNVPDIGEQVLTID